jgi:hypothetical protein
LENENLLRKEVVQSHQQDPVTRALPRVFSHDGSERSKAKRFELKSTHYT